jgi:hypothetical protein
LLQKLDLRVFLKFELVYVGAVHFEGIESIERRSKRGKIERITLQSHLLQFVAHFFRHLLLGLPQSDPSLLVERVKDEITSISSESE